MANKMRFLFLTILFFVIIPCALFAQQNAFYGTWIGKMIDDDFDNGYYEATIYTVTISSSSFSLRGDWYEEEKLVETENETVRIRRWSAINNTNRETRTDFPNGFSINCFFEGEEVDLELFISGDGRRLIINELTDDNDRMIVFRKRG
ncbi:MAG: hypothetical protein FWC01_08780 [Treponema sp.]|nr:hypothetical protein [Treponema sp.]